MTDAGQAEHHLPVLADESDGVLDLGAVVGGERAVRAVRRLATDMDGGAVVVGGCGTFISRLLAGFGVAVDWPFSRMMPMPAIYRLRLTDQGCQAVGPRLVTGSHVGAG